MRKNFKTILKLFALGTIFVLGGCEKDDLETNEDESKKRVVEKVNLSQIPIIQNAIAERKNNNTTFLRKSKEELLNLIKTDEVVVLTDTTGEKSYTFALTLEETDKMTNLVIQEENNSLKYYSVEYTGAEFAQWKDNLENNIISDDIKPDVYFDDLDNPQISNRINPCYIATVTVTCPSGKHDYSCVGQCTYDLSLWTSTTTYTAQPCGGATPMSGATSVNNSGGGIATPENPCQRLKDLFDPTKGDVATIAGNLFGTIPQTQGENGNALYAAPNGYHSDVTLNQNTAGAASGNYTIQMPTSAPNLYGGIHTHPLDAYPMFSWTDVVMLNSIAGNIDHHNRKKAVFMLACIDANGNNQLYAIVIDPVGLVTIADFLDRPEYDGCTPEDVGEIMDYEIEEKYNKEYNLPGTPNYEKAFLRQMFGLNVKLYKANSNLSSWNQLKLNSLTGNVLNAPCN